MTETTFHILHPEDTSLINQIADWYLSEWNIPKERTVVRLKLHHREDILFHLILKVGDRPVATGGLYNNVGLLSDQPKYNMYGPWIALLYTDINYRNQGLGAELLSKIEEQASSMGFKKIFLYTFTAEELYKRNSWIEIDRTIYKGHDTVVMEKEI